MVVIKQVNNKKVFELSVDAPTELGNLQVGILLKRVYNQENPNHTKQEYVEYVTHLYNLRKSVEMLLSKLLIPQETPEFQRVVSDVINVVKGLQGFKTVELHFMGERHPGLYILKGVADVPVGGEWSDSNIHIEYALGILTSMIPFGSDDYNILEQYKEYIPVFFGKESIKEYEPIPNYHFEVIKSVFIRRVNGF